MPSFGRSFLICVLMACGGLSFSLSGAESRALLLVGGAIYPTKALEAVLEQTNSGESVVISILTWGRMSHAESTTFDRLQRAFTRANLDDKDLRFYHISAPDIDLSAQNHHRYASELIAKINASHIVFFTGGDQNEIMKSLARFPEASALIKQRYANTQLILAGASAGTAIMSTSMIRDWGEFGVISDETVSMGEGLGIIQDFVVDQHFIERQRQNRLYAAMFKTEKDGLAVDEGAAVLIMNESHLKVYGESFVNVCYQNEDRSFQMYFLREGESIDLPSRIKK